MGRGGFPAAKNPQICQAPIKLAQPVPATELRVSQFKNFELFSVQEACDQVAGGLLKIHGGGRLLSEEGMEGWGAFSFSTK